MRIFWKHIFRSIKRSPLQSLLIVITLMIATASLLISVKSFFAIRDDLAAKEGVDNYVSDITVKLSARSELRILFEDDLTDAVGDFGKVLGEFALEGLCEKNGERRAVKLYAVDFKKADAFYKFKFIDYGRFTTENYKNSIIISRDFASEYGLSVGDEFSFLLLNRTFDFTVQAIAVTDGPFYECGGVFSIDAVRDVLALSNPVISSFADSFTPYSQLRVRVNDEAEIDTVLEMISSDERFGDKIVFKNSEAVGKYDFFTKISMWITGITSVLVVILSAIVVSSSLDLIRDKRRTDTALFALCGAERRHLNKIVHLEGALYSVFGAIGGVPLAQILYAYVNKTLRFGENGIVALLASCVVTLISTFIHLCKQRRKTSYELINEGEATVEGGHGIKILAVESVALVLALTATWILPTSDSTVPSIVSMFVFLLWFLSASPIVLKLLASLAVSLLLKLKRVPPLAFMTFKNMVASHPLRHTGRLIATLSVILFMISFSVFSVKDQVDVLENVFECDYLAIGADDKCDELVRSGEGVKDSYRIDFFQNVKTEHGTTVMCVSADEKALTYVNGSLGVSSLPKNDQIFVSLGVAKVCGVGVGDEIRLYVEGQYCSFTVAEILEISSNFVFIDARYIGVGNNKLAILMQGEGNEAEEISKLSAILNPRGAAVLKFYDVVSVNTEFPKTVLAYLEFITVIAIFTTLIGVVNLILSQHNARRQEFFVLYSSGFTRRRVFLLEVCEILSVIILALLIAVPGGYLLTAIFDFAVNAFGADFLH